MLLLTLPIHSQIIWDKNYGFPSTSYSFKFLSELDQETIVIVGTKGHDDRPLNKPLLQFYSHQGEPLGEHLLDPELNRNLQPLALERGFGRTLLLTGVGLPGDDLSEYRSYRIYELEGQTANLLTEIPAGPEEQAATNAHFLTVLSDGFLISDAYPQTADNFFVQFNTTRILRYAWDGTKIWQRDFSYSVENFSFSFGFLRPQTLTHFDVRGDELCASGPLGEREFALKIDLQTGQTIREWFIATHTSPLPKTVAQTVHPDGTVYLALQQYATGATPLLRLLPDGGRDSFNLMVGTVLDIFPAPDLPGGFILQTITEDHTAIVERSFDADITQVAETARSYNADALSFVEGFRAIYPRSGGAFNVLGEGAGYFLSIAPASAQPLVQVALPHRLQGNADHIQAVLPVRDGIYYVGRSDDPDTLYNRRLWLLKTDFDGRLLHEVFEYPDFSFNSTLHLSETPDGDLITFFHSGNAPYVLYRHSGNLELRWKKEGRTYASPYSPQISYPGGESVRVAILPKIDDIYDLSTGDFVETDPIGSEVDMVYTFQLDNGFYLGYHGSINPFAPITLYALSANRVEGRSIFFNFQEEFGNTFDTDFYPLGNSVLLTVTGEIDEQPMLRIYRIDHRLEILSERNYEVPDQFRLRFDNDVSERNGGLLFHHDLLFVTPDELIDLRPAGLDRFGDIRELADGSFVAVGNRSIGNTLEGFATRFRLHGLLQHPLPSVTNEFLQIAPNPAESFVRIQFPRDAAFPVRYRLMNELGQTLRSGAFSTAFDAKTDTYLLSIDELQRGRYAVEFTDAGQRRFVGWVVKL